MEWIVGVGVAGGGFVGLIISLVVKDRGEKGARAAATQKNHLLEKSEELDARIKTHFTKEDSQRPDNLVKALSPEQFTTLALAFNNNLEQQQQLLLLATQDQKTHLYQKIKSQPENFNQQLRWQIFCALENLPANVVDRLINVGERIKAAFALENSDDKATMLLKLLPYIKDFIGGISFKHFTFAQLEAAFDNYSPELKILAIKKLSYQAISDIQEKSEGEVAQEEKEADNVEEIDNTSLTKEIRVEVNKRNTNWERFLILKNPARKEVRTLINLRQEWQHRVKSAEDGPEKTKAIFALLPYLIRMKSVSHKLLQNISPEEFNTRYAAYSLQNREIFRRKLTQPSHKQILQMWVKARSKSKKNFLVADLLTDLASSVEDKQKVETWRTALQNNKEIPKQVQDQAEGVAKRIVRNLP